MFTGGSFGEWVRRAGIITSALALIGLAAPPAGAALPNTSTPTLQLARTIRTSPFVGSSVSTRDLEGSAYVLSDNSLWLADDNGRSIYEVDPSTGALKRQITGSMFDAVTKYGGGPTAGKYRDSDLESMAYDTTNDILYAFSGKCCNSSELPTVFRLLRDGSGRFQLDSYQPLSSSSDFTAAGWNPGDGKTYVGVGSDIRTYDYATNTAGPTFRISNLSGILGMSFSADGNDLFVARKSTTLSRVNWQTKSLMSGWTFSLSSFGVKDSRAVELINDQLYVADGYDNRNSGDPLNHAVFVFNVLGPNTAPTASFTASPTSGTAPLTVQLTDTSSGGPTSWSWTFGDGGTSSAQSPSHQYTTAGTYTTTLTATNTNGSSSSSKTITVNAAVAPTASFTATPTSGTAPLTVHLTDTSTGSSTSWSWDFGDGGTSTAQSPSHQYTAAGTYTAILTAGNTNGSTSASTTIAVSPGIAPTASFTATPTSGDAPLTVQFTDTSAGSPTSWSWDFGDGGTSTAQSPSHQYTSAGTYTATLTAMNTNGSTSASAQITVTTPPLPSGNLVGNPGFETNLTGWNTSGYAGVSLNRVAGGHSGGWSAQLSNTSSGSTCKLNDSPNWVATTVPGTYTVSIWVRADSPGATIKLKFVEYQASTNVGSTSAQATLSTSWQKVTMTYTPVAPGASTLDFGAYVSSAPVGTCFYADDASITVT